MAPGARNERSCEIGPENLLEDDWGDDYAKTFSINLIWAQANDKDMGQSPPVHTNSPGSRPACCAIIIVSSEYEAMLNGTPRNALHKL